MVKQINNIKIYRHGDKFICKARGIALEEFKLLSEAEDWCRETKDFLSNGWLVASDAAAC